MADRITEWQRRVCLAVVRTDDVPPRPEWSKTGVPGCLDSCPHHDGKRCQLIGFRPDAICEPVVVAMASRIGDLEAALAEALELGRMRPLWGSELTRLGAVLASAGKDAT